MSGKGPFLAFAVLALLPLQFAQCGVGPGPQSAQCCHSMPCTPANQGQGCCKTMVSQLLALVPAAHASLNPPSVLLVGKLATPELALLPQVPRAVGKIERPPPQALYTLHASLLI